MSNNLERLALLAIIVGSLVCLGLTGRYPPDKTFNSAGVMFDMAGVVQLHLAGLFSTLVRDYFDKMTLIGGGAPINGRMRAIRARDAQFWLRRQLFVNPRTGYILILGGFALQWVAVWL
ncbi:MAG: hypothetical protein HC850_11585 [Rhodomicrobium sp.]|nr:hypothetical protein [Rhodomicrobium sp.]